MLNKELCKRCWKEYDYQQREEKGWLDWDEEAEKDWKKYLVLCPETYWARVDEKPPSHCPYELEHIVGTQKC